jgi:hypothetical protein
MILGDALPKLSPKGLDMLRRVLDRLPNAARPLDLFSDNSPASRWRAKTEEGWLMGYFNWDDFPKDIQVDPSDWGGRTAMLKDFWTDRRIPVRQPVLHLPPHHSRLLRIIGG